MLVNVDGLNSYLPTVERINKGIFAEKGNIFVSLFGSESGNKNFEVRN
jgi:hypothetical protein